MPKNLSISYVLRENVESFFNKHPLPVFYDSEDKSSLIEFISKYRSDVLDDFDFFLANDSMKNCSIDIYNKLTSIKIEIEIEFESIIKALKCVNDSSYGEAEDIIDKLFENAEGRFCVTDINNFSALPKEIYRIRQNIDKDEILSIDLFHVPYTKRNLLTNERFSISGQPCLYLSTSLSIAWQECGMPPSFYYSEYKYNEDRNTSNDEWQFLSFRSPKDIINYFLISKDFFEEECNIDFIFKYLRTFPVIFACSIASINKNYPFKPEYVFPQLVMQWVHRNINKIKGVMYFSCVYSDDDLCWSPAYNIALPATDFNDEGYSLPLLSKFKIEKPIYESASLNDELKSKFACVFNKIRSLEAAQGDLISCHLDMQRLMRYMVLLVKEPENIPQDFFLAFLDLLFARTCAFRREYDITTLIDDFKKSSSYKEDDETYIEQFRQVFQEFIDIIEIFNRYRLKSKHDYPGLFDSKLNYIN